MTGWKIFVKHDSLLSGTYCIVTFKLLCNFTVIKFFIRTTHLCSVCIHLTFKLPWPFRLSKLGLVRISFCAQNLLINALTKFGRLLVNHAVFTVSRLRVTWTVFRRVRKIAKSDYWLRYACPPTRNNSAPTGRIFMKTDVLDFSKICQEIQVSLKSDKNDGCFTWRPVYILDILLVLLRMIKNFR
jgi:hypothetical protein